MNLRKTIELYHQSKMVLIALNGKIPTEKNWQNKEWSKDGILNIKSQSVGWVIPDNYLVIDVDNNHGKDEKNNLGSESLEKMSEYYNYNFMAHAGIITNTASGGFHLYYKKPNKFLNLDTKNSLSDFPSIEFKGKKRQVVIPNSTLPNGRKYSFNILSSHSFSDIKELPESIVADLVNNQQLPEVHVTPEGNYHPQDLKIDQDRFKDFLTNQPELGQGERDSSFYILACKGKEFGLSKTLIFELLKEFNNFKVRPKFPQGQILKCVNSAFQYSQNKLPINSIAEDFNDKKLGKIEVGDLLEVKELNLEECLPDELKDFVEDTSLRLTVPNDFIAIPLITGLSSLIAGRALIKPKRKDNFCVPPNLWGGIVCNPSSRKSDSLKEALFFFAGLEKIAEEEYINKMSEYESQSNLYKIKKQALEEELKKLIKKANPTNDIENKLNELKEPQKPCLKRFRINHATTQKITEILRDNDNSSILLERDELSGFISELEKKENDSDRSYFLESWSGTSSPKSDTIIRGYVTALNAAISIIGTTQHDKIKSYIERAATNLNDGLLQRFQLFVYPNPNENLNYVDEVPNQKAREKILEIVNYLIEADFFNTSSGEIEKNGKFYPFFIFSDEAQSLYVDWYIKINKKIRDFTKVGKNLLAQHFGKYHKLLPALCLIFHLCKANNATKSIDKNTISKAIKFCEYLESHAVRIYGIIGNDNRQKANALNFLEKAKEKFKSGNNSEFFKKEFTEYELGRKFTPFRKGLGEIIDILVQYNYLSESITAPSYQQRGKYSYSFNPDLLQRWSEE